MYMNKGLVEPVRRVKLWAPGFPGAHFDGVKVGVHELRELLRKQDQEIMISIQDVGIRGAER